MNDQKFTRCPGCSTVFRVTPAQLALREGQVRCGHCRAVFDANDHLVSLDAAPPPDEFDATDELMMGRPTVTLRSADALQRLEPVADEGAGREERRIDITVEGTVGAGRDERRIDATVEGTEGEGAGERIASEEATGTIADTGIDEAASAGAVPDDKPRDDSEKSDAAVAEEPRSDAAADDIPTDGAPAAAAEPAATEGETRDAGSATDPRASVGEGTPTSLNASGSVLPARPIDIAAVGPARRFEWKKRTAQDAAPRRGYVIAAVALLGGLAVQAVFEFRDALAAHVPATRPVVESACRLLGCSIEPLRDATALSIDASDLQADPAHRGLLLLSATIRNRAAHAIAFPYLELTLLDASERVVARRAFPPGDYAGGTADPHEGIPPNGERVVRMFLDASATQQAGYRLYLFYP